MLKPYTRAQLHFRHLREIGAEGQNSRTFVSHDRQLDAEIVIKEVNKTRVNTAEYFAEAKALYASNHPNVVPVYYACEDDDNIYLAMPFYSRGSLKSLMNTRHLTVREMVAVGCQVLTALHNVHSKKLVHFDVKPDNVLLSDRGEALLADFGLAKQINGRGVAEQEGFYVRMKPPESFRGYEFDARFDIYQFGLLLYRMCNGNDVFYEQFERFIEGGVFNRNAFMVAVRNGQFPDRTAFPAHASQRLRAVVRTCLAVEPSDRFQSAIEVANALAVIDDETLDWRFSKVGDTRRWERNKDGTLYEFEAHHEGATTCHKTVGAGARRRFSDGCSGHMTERQIRTFLGAH